MRSLSLEVSLVWGCTGMSGLSLDVLSDAVEGMSGLRLFSLSLDHLCEDVQPQAGMFALSGSDGSQSESACLAGGCMVCA